MVTETKKEHLDIQEIKDQLSDLTHRIELLRGYL